MDADRLAAAPMSKALLLLALPYQLLYLLGQGLQLLDEHALLRESTPVQGGRPHEDRAGGGVLRNAGLRHGNRAVPDAEMACHPNLARQDDPVAKMGAAGNAALRDKNARTPHLDIVADLDQVVNLRAGLNPGAAETRTVNGGVGAHLDVVVKLDNPDLRNLLVAGGGGLVAKPVRTYHHPDAK